MADYVCFEKKKDLGRCVQMLIEVTFEGVGEG